MFGEAEVDISSYLLYGLIYKPQNVGGSLSQSHSLKQNVDRVRRQQLTFSQKYLIWFYSVKMVMLPESRTIKRNPAPQWPTKKYM